MTSKSCLHQTWHAHAHACKITVEGLLRLLCVGDVVVWSAALWSAALWQQIGHTL